jgi:hypothetical protein
MQFRFLYAAASITLATAINAVQTSITVAPGAVTPATPFDAFVCICSPSGETGETMTVTNVSGSSWTVTRGPTAAAAVAGTTLFIDPQPITGPLVTSPLLVGQDTVLWPGQSGGLATSSTVSTFRQVYVGYGTDQAQPAAGAHYEAPTHYVPPDPTTGWVPMDTGLIAGGVTVFLNFDTTQPGAAPGGYPFGSASLALGTPGGAPAGSAVPAAEQKAGTDLAIIFQATRVGTTAIDYSNSLCKIHINNWSEVNNLWFFEFTTGGASCCTPIDNTLSVQFTVDHEEMNAGGWGLSISSCPPSAGSTCQPAPGGITPNDQTLGATFTVGDDVTTLAAPITTTTQTSITVASSATGLSTPFSVSVTGTGETMTVTNISGTTWTVSRGQDGTTAATAPAGTALATYRGAWGTLVQHTGKWCSCSYIAQLSTRPGLTTGLFDYRGNEEYLTFCICGHGGS